MNKIINKDCIIGMRELPDNSIDCCVTSPPYFGLRDYGHKEQIGLEETPELYIAKMVEVFAEVKRVLKKEGTLWLNLGDSYCSTAPGTRNAPSTKIHSGEASVARANMRPATPSGMKPKDLIGIPWMVAFALRSSGWYLRQDIIWHKPNPMPESVTDRCTKSHEYIFLLSKSPQYYYDHIAIRTPIKDSTIQRMQQQIDQQKGSDRVPGKVNGNMKAVGPGRSPRDGIDIRGGNQGSETGIKAVASRPHGIVRDRLLDYDSKEKQLRDKTKRGGYENENDIPLPDGEANKKSVWTVTTKPYSEAHFATFPEDLIVDMIKAGCPENGVILDPFMGAGTTALVASKLHRQFLGFELNEEYIKIANRRLQKHLGFFNPNY